MKHKILILPPSFKPPKFPHKLLLMNNSLNSSTSSSKIKPCYNNTNTNTNTNNNTNIHTNTNYYVTNNNSKTNHIIINPPKRYISPITDSNESKSIKSNLRTRLFNIISSSMIMNKNEAEELKLSYENDITLDHHKKELKKLNAFRQANHVNIHTNKSPNILMPMATGYRYEDEYVTPKEVLVKNFNKEEIEMMRRYPNYFKLNRIPGIDNEMKTRRNLTEIIKKEDKINEIISKDRKSIKAKYIGEKRLYNTDGNHIKNIESDSDGKQNDLPLQKEHIRANSCFDFDKKSIKNNDEIHQRLYSNKDEDYIDEGKVKRIAKININDGHYKYHSESVISPSPSLKCNNLNKNKLKKHNTDFPFPKEYYYIDQESIIKSTIIKRSLYKQKLMENIDYLKQRRLSKKNLNDTLIELKKNYRILKGN